MHIPTAHALSNKGWTTKVLLTTATTLRAFSDPDDDPNFSFDDFCAGVLGTLAASGFYWPHLCLQSLFSSPIVNLTASFDRNYRQNVWITMFSAALKSLTICFFQITPRFGHDNLLPHFSPRKSGKQIITFPRKKKRGTLCGAKMCMQINCFLPKLINFRKSLKSSYET